ncbi:MAG TPA: substrate-binding domain-containing protein [Bryobacteraceae bacterium]|nr:substrate-binding domain-containing protein [Bryobacteraceae bacterium]
MERDRSYANAVVRACDVLKAFRNEADTLTLADLVDRTGLSKTTVFRLLQSLIRGGLAERVDKGVYSSRIRLLTVRTFRLGFAAQTDSEFCREVTASLERAAAREKVHLITVNNRYSPREALRNADLLVREHVDLVLEYQTYERVAPIIASKFLEANIPVIAIEIPHPSATYFGANNYQAGLIGGKALGRWAKQHWRGEVEQVLLLELPIAGPLPQLRITGMVEGLRVELPSVVNAPAIHLDGKGDFDQILDVVRRFLRRTKLKRTLVGAVNDMCALAALRAFEEAGGGTMCAVMGQNAVREARQELRRPGTRLIGSVAYFPERYGDELIPLCLSILQKKPTPAAVFVKHQLITPENVRLIYPLDGV